MRHGLAWVTALTSVLLSGLASAQSASSAAANHDVVVTAKRSKKLPSPHSWGKTGISYDEYRKDAFECTYTSFQKVQEKQYHTPKIFDSPQIVIGVNGAVDYDATLNNFLMARNVQEMTRQSNAIGSLQEAIDSCLSDRGYTPFRLSTEQATELKSLQHGTEGRHRFLYNLASSSDIINHQGI